MRVLRGCFWTLCLLGLVLPFGIQGQLPEAPVKTNKIIVYPKKGESISQLKQSGIHKIDDYGSYWVVRATDAQSKEIARNFGDRAVKANHLNYIELEAVRLDTTVGEHAIPSNLQEIDTGGERLRLIQFKGPVKPEWLEQVKAAGNLKVVSYIPNNAYVVWLDADAEQKLQNLRDPQGPLQWIGPYHPYYKIPINLLTAEPGKLGGTVAVQVAVVDHSETSQTANTIQALGAARASYSLPGQKVFSLNVPQSEISRIAQLPDVLWIQSIQTKRLMDEVQDLVLESQTNFPTSNIPPQHGPTPLISPYNGTNYLYFLTNAVGGGMASFTDQSTYPIVDIADTGLDGVVGYYYPNIGDSTVPTAVPPYPVSPVFYEFGNPNFQGLPDFFYPSPLSRSRVAYEQPPYISYGAGTSSSDFLGCDRVNNNFFGAEDFDGHGTRVASIVSGFDTNNTENYNCRTTVGIDPVTGDPIYTYQAYTVPRRDSYGFQYGMGISPFGRIGASRVFSQGASASKVGDQCQILITVPVFCVSSLPSLVSYAYAQGARIQNNSWGDVLQVSGLNAGQYNGESLAYDIAVRDSWPSGTNTTPRPFPLNQEFIAVFAGGDSGSAGGAGGFVDMRVTAPATAKNIIAVGTSENARNADENSFAFWPQTSPGPTSDGRFKPEIVAPGTTISGALHQIVPSVGNTNACSPIVSTNVTQYPVNPYMVFGCYDANTARDVNFFSNLYLYDSGSSYAAPAVSGGIQLLWWYFQHRLTNELGQVLLQPSPAMAKAYLLNSARYLSFANPLTGTNDTLPSIIQGMGEMDLQRMFDGVPRVIRDESTPRAINTPLITTNPAPQQIYFSQVGQSYEVSGQVRSNGLPFRVTLAWTDAPGSPAALQQLVNDLDLDVTIGGQIYKGNYFRGDHSVPGGPYDRVNNVESVFLPAGGAVTSGAPYTVVVRAATIAADGVPNVGSSLDQDFALVIYNSDRNITTLSDVPNLATNNSCATAMAITNNPFSFTNTLSSGVTIGITGTNGYNNVQPSPSAGLGGADEFFKLANPTPGGVFAVDTIGSSFNTLLSVWSTQAGGVCGALVEVTSINGGLSSALTFTADGSNDYYIVAEPSGDGPGGTLVLNVNATAPAIVVTPTNLVFADEMVGLTSAVQTVTYQNNTTVTIGILSVSITGSNATDFVIQSDSCAGNAIGPGRNCTINVAFAPTTNGLRTAQLVINDDATGSPRIVPLSGNGLPAIPLVCLSSSSLVFGNQAVGTTNFQTVTVTNCGSAALVISSITLTGPGSSAFFTNSISCLPFPATNTAGQWCAINIGFDPLANGNPSATLSIVDNASGSPHQVNLTGTGCTPITLTPATLPDATTGAPYNQLITASGGVPQYFYAVTSGIFPPGLTLLSSGAFSGTPTLSGSFTFTVTAVDANLCSGSREYTIHVSCPVLGLTSLTQASAQAGVPYNQTITVTNGVPPITFALTGAALPSGLTLFSGGTIVGTPVAVGSFTFTVKATDSDACTGTRTYTITVSCPTITLSPASLPNAIIGQAYSRTITASGGTAPYNFSVTHGFPPSGLSLSGAGLLSGTPNSSSNFTFTVAAVDANNCSGTVTYAVSVNCPTMTLLPTAFPNATVGIPYSQANSVSGGTPPYTIALTSGSVPPGLTYTNGVLSGTPTIVGTYSFTISATDSNNCSVSRAYSLQVNCGALTLVPQTLPDAGLGALYNQTITVSSGTSGVTFARTLGSLPPGIMLTSSGTLTGTPTVVGPFTFKVTAIDPTSNCLGERFYTIKVGCPAISVSPASLPFGNVGTPYSQTNLTASGGAAPYKFIQTGGSLPAGMTLSSAGTLSGTPLSGSTVFTVTVTDSNSCSSSASYMLILSNNCPAITVSPGSLPGGVAGVAYNQTFSSSGGLAPYTFSVFSGSLPPGLGLSPSGVLSGPPTAAGPFTFTIAALDANGCSGFQPYAVNVACTTITVSPSTLATGTVGVAYSQTIMASSGLAPLSFSITSGTLPPGLSLAGSGALAGTPTAAGTFAFTVTATDAASCTGSQLYSLTINPATDLAISKSASPDPVLVGSNLTYTIVVTNLGPFMATSVTLTDALPSSLTFVSASSGCSPVGNVVVCDLGSLASGASTTVTVIATAPAAAIITNTASVSAGVPDPETANNTATAISTASDVVLFSASLSVVHANAGGAVVNVKRLGGTYTPATVQYASSNGSAVAGTDYVATSGSLAFDPGVMNRSFTVPILNSSVGKGGKTVQLALHNPTGASLGDPSASTINIIGSPRTSPVVFTNADGDVVTMKLSGAGAMQVSLVGNGVGPIDHIDQILLTNTDATSSLSVSVKRGKQGVGLIDIGSIVGSSLKSLNAPGANVVGDGISLGGALGSVTVNSVRNSRITAGSQIKSANVQSFDGSVITAPQIGTVKLVNVNTNAVSGVTASGSISSVTVSHPKFRWNKSGSVDQSLGDFHVQH